MIKKRGLRIRTNNKYPLGQKQARFLSQMLIDDEVKLSKREHFVVKHVLDANKYHDNHQYHLNKLRLKYYHIMEKID